MRTLTRIVWPLVSIALGAAACGGGGNTPPPPPACANVEGTLSVAGLELKKPDRDAVACVEGPNPKGGTPALLCERKVPDFSCVGTPAPTGTPVNVTFRGCLSIFGLGANYVDLTVTILREHAADGSAVDPGYDILGVPGQQADKTPAAVIAKSTTHQVADTECRDLGAFEIAGVPTETDLIIRVTQQAEEAGNRQFVDTYQYNIRLPNSAVTDAAKNAIADPVATCTGATPCFVTDEINTIAIATFFTIPRAAGVSAIEGESDLFDGMGQGHIAGEVQDCTSKDSVQNAVVAIDSEARKLAYFNVGFDPNEGNIEDPKPNSTRNRTNADGLYAAIGVNTQTGGKPVKLVAAAMPSVCGADGICKCGDNGEANPMWSAPDANEAQPVALGSRTVYVFPDSITIMTFDRGLFQTRL
ncbi:MAG: hypothetical protein IT384_33540 [Deltaproteobacteria bacterium]|nr:hypothetical protein [Deltaproteobacteria bacterium]